MFFRDVHMPVYLFGQLDALSCNRMLGILTQDAIDIRIKRFGVVFDRTLPDAFIAANIGPCRYACHTSDLRAGCRAKAGGAST